MICFTVREESPGLAQCLTVFGDGRININTASKPVLRALAAEMTDDEVDRLDKYRRDPRNDLADPGWYQKLPRSTGINIPEGLIVVRGDTFRITAVGLQGRMTERITGVVKREADPQEGKTVVLEGGMMPERILGLDIGGSSVKAVLLSRGFRGGYRVLGFRRVDATAAGGPAEALEKLFADDTFRGAVCVTALHAGMLSFRSIRLPFRDDRKIRQTLAFALEPVIQTPLEEVFIDYTHGEGEGKSEIFAALAPRTLVGERTELLKPYVRETEVIDVSAVSLTLRLTRNKSGPETVLMLDVGARDTTAVFACEGRIRHIRHFPFGGETATQAIAAVLNSDFTEAEAVKRSGEISPAAVAAIGEVCRRFCIELGNTRTSLIWQGAIAQTPDLVLLTGGGSRTPGLGAILAESFSAPVEQADLLAEGDIQIEETLRQSWDPAVMDQALALAARPMVKGSGFNFRQLASEARAGYGEFRDRLKKGAHGGRRYPEPGRRRDRA